MFVIDKHKQYLCFYNFHTKNKYLYTLYENLYHIKTNSNLFSCYFNFKDKNFLLTSCF